MSNWISVDERLPRLRTDVIVHLRDVTEPDVSGTVVPLIFGLDGKYGFFCITVTGIEDWSEDVTHWMPLPEPPPQP